MTNTTTLFNRFEVFSPTIEKEFERIVSEFLNFENPDLYKTSAVTYPNNFYVQYSEAGEVIKTVIQFALAGVPKDAINIEVEGNKLVINVQDKTNINEQDKYYKYFYNNITKRKMHIYYTLSDKCSIENIKTTYKDGLLTIEIPSKLAQIPEKKKLEIT